MTDLNGCNVCGGGDNNFHKTNPDPSVREITQVGNIVFHPAPAKPEQWCLHHLKNVSTETIEGSPLGWNSDECTVGVVGWPQPEIVPWDSTAAEAPPVCPVNSDGVWTLYTDSANDGALSHVCVDGVLVQVGGAGGAGGDCCQGFMMADQLCNPIMVVWNSVNGFTFFNEDLVAVPRPASLKLPELCVDACDVCTTIVNNEDGTFSVFQEPGTPFLIDTRTGVLCSAITVSGGVTFTGQPSGLYIDGCTEQPINLGDPESLYPAADFPEGWRQRFTGGRTGSESYEVQKDLAGQNQWHLT